MLSVSKINRITGMTTVVIIVVMLFSCNGEKKDAIEVVFDPQTSYTMKETNIETLVSDSGITRCKVITDTYLKFDKASEPFWYFPDGVYLEKYDTAFNVEASVKADTAWYYERRKLWKLTGNVDITNMEGKRLETNELFWDQNKEKIYTDSLYRITEGDKVSGGTGFISNQDLTIRESFNSKGEFYINEKTSPAQEGVAPQDTINPPKVSLDAAKEVVAPQDTIKPAL
jgi:LPS export ABC transporter protein LptC